jgi:hypothetical protein
MQDRMYLVTFRDPDFTPQLVKAVTAEIHGEHLVFLTSTGKLSALFLLEIIESWDLNPESN